MSVAWLKRQEERNDDRKQLILQLPHTVSAAVTVKFATDTWYKINLYNEADIPAIPFEFQVEQ